MKSLFRRGKAFCCLAEGKEARADLSKCVALDPSTAAAANKLLAKLAEDEKQNNEKDKKIYANLFSKNEKDS